MKDSSILSATYDSIVGELVGYVNKPIPTKTFKLSVSGDPMPSMYFVRVLKVGPVVDAECRNIVPGSVILVQTGDFREVGKIVSCRANHILFVIKDEKSLWINKEQFQVIPMMGRKPYLK